MSETGTARGFWIAFVLLTLLGVTALGRLAIETWLVQDEPDRLPRIGGGEGPPPPLLFIVIDGLREQSAFSAEDPPMPWFEGFASLGAHGVAITGEPTLTAPCVRCLLSGRRPDLLTAFRNFNAEPTMGTIVGYAVERGARATHGGDAAIYQFCKPWFRELGHVYQVPDQGPVDQGETDAKAVPFVLERIQAGFTLATVHLTGPDHAGHRHGATGRPYWQACRTVDEQLRTLVDAFTERHPHGYVFIASDHGVSDMGTHGGGEETARRAPFLMVGPGLAPGYVVTDQSALAPTLAAAMGLCMPPLADAPPDLRMLTLDPETERQVLADYVAARLAVLSSADIDPVERRRVRETLDELGSADLSRLEVLSSDVNRSLSRGRLGLEFLVLGLAVLWLCLCVHLACTRELAPRRTPWVAAALGALFLACFLLPGALTYAGLLVAGMLLVGTAMPRRAPRGVLVTMGGLAIVPVGVAGMATLQHAWELGMGGEALQGRRDLFAATALVAAVLFLRPRRLFAHMGRLGARHPGLIAAFGGAVLGALLTMRDFVDNLIHPAYLSAGLALLCVYYMTRGARRPWIATAAALLVYAGSRVMGLVLDEPRWVQALGSKMSAPWFLAGAVATLLALALLWRRARPRREDRLGAYLAVAALLAAFAVRIFELSGAVAHLPTGLGLSALVWSAGRGSLDGRLSVRLIATLALARRLADMDATFLVLALATILGIALSALHGPRTRAGLAWLAVMLILLRAGLFHAMGYTEDFGTLDVGQAFTGLAAAGDDPAGEAGTGGGVTANVVFAGIQLSLYHVLPWVLMLAVCARACARRRLDDGAAGASDLRTLCTDLALSGAARAALILFAFAIWWQQSWWSSVAYTVYAFGSADVLLGSLCALLAGALARDARPPRPAG